MTKPIPESIKLSQINGIWMAYAVQFRHKGPVHVRADASFDPATLCGREGEGARVDKPITCKVCIKLLIKNRRLVKEGVRV